ncbi:MAG TPA: glycosyltransferase family 87 protein, partial [Pseudomonadales bacterium]|nr:glycosyltransferase family 87 protein [Pseudomonadales bacterium]
ARKGGGMKQASVVQFAQNQAFMRRLLMLLVVAIIGYTVYPLHTFFRGWNDFRWVYVAGKTWLQGDSPYNFPVFGEIFDATPYSLFTEKTNQPFMYPPHWSLLAVPLGGLSYEAANRIWDFLSVSAYLGTLWLLFKLTKARLQQANAQQVVLLLVCLATLNGAIRFHLTASQMSLIPLFGVVGAFFSWEQRDTVNLALFAFIAMLKPQISLLPLLFLLLNGGHRGVLIGGVAATVVSLVSLGFTQNGILAFPEHMIDCIGRHMGASFNKKESFSNLSALIARIPNGKHYFWIGPTLAFVWLLGMVYWYKRHQNHPQLKNPVLLLALVCAATPALIPLHVYDLVIYTPVLFASIFIRPWLLSIVIVLLVQIVGRVHLLSKASLDMYKFMPLLTMSILISTSVAIIWMTRSATNKSIQDNDSALRNSHLQHTSAALLSKKQRIF